MKELCEKVVEARKSIDSDDCCCLWRRCAEVD